MDKLCNQFRRNQLAQVIRKSIKFEYFSVLPRCTSSSPVVLLPGWARELDWFLRCGQCLDSWIIPKQGFDSVDVRALVLID